MGSWGTQLLTYKGTATYTVDLGKLTRDDISLDEEKMMEKLEAQKTIEEADRFAKMSVLEIYQPIINAVTTGYSLEIEFVNG